MKPWWLHNFFFIYYQGFTFNSHFYPSSLFSGELGDYMLPCERRGAMPETWSAGSKVISSQDPCQDWLWTRYSLEGRTKHNIWWTMVYAVGFNLSIMCTNTNVILTVYERIIWHNGRPTWCWRFSYTNYFPCTSFKTREGRGLQLSPPPWDARQGGSRANDRKEDDNLSLADQLLLLKSYFDAKFEEFSQTIFLRQFWGALILLPSTSRTIALPWRNLR